MDVSYGFRIPLEIANANGFPTAVVPVIGGMALRLVLTPPTIRREVFRKHANADSIVRLTLLSAASLHSKLSAFDDRAYNKGGAEIALSLLSPLRNLTPVKHGRFFHGIATAKALSTWYANFAVCTIQLWRTRK